MGFAGNEESSFCWQDLELDKQYDMYIMWSIVINILRVMP